MREKTSPKLVDLTQHDDLHGQDNGGDGDAPKQTNYKNKPKKTKQKQNKRRHVGYACYGVK